MTAKFSDMEVDAQGNSRLVGAMGPGSITFGDIKVTSHELFWRYGDSSMDVWAARLDSSGNFKRALVSGIWKSKETVRSIASGGAGMTYIAGANGCIMKTSIPCAVIGVVPLFATGGYLWKLDL